MGVRRLGELERWIAENLTADLRVERLAERVGMSPRNFARRYTETRKRTTACAVDALRVEAAQRALEENDDRINEIAERCGFTDEERMRNAFCAAAAASTLASKAAVKKNRRPASFSFHFLTNEMKKRGECAQECAQNSVPKRAFATTSQLIPVACT